MFIHILDQNEIIISILTFSFMLSVLKLQRFPLVGGNKDTLHINELDFDKYLP